MLHHWQNKFSDTTGLEFAVTRVPSTPSIAIAGRIRTNVPALPHLLHRRPPTRSFSGDPSLAHPMHNSSSSGPSAKPRVGASQASEASLKRKRGVFQKDLQHMMYGFGDDPNPLPETVSLVEDIVTEYITDMVHKAQNFATKRGRLLTEDFLYLVRKDPPKLRRSAELLAMHEELKLARKAFDVNEDTLANAE